MSKYNYIITMHQPDYKRIDAISLLMLTLALSVFGYTIAQYYSSAKYHNAVILYEVIFSVIVLWCVYSLFFAGRLNRIPYYRIALMAAGIGWFTEPVSNFWMTGLYFIAALLERQVKFSQELGVDENGITFNTFPAKSYSWKDITNLLLKDGIITVEFAGNKLFQKEIESDVSAALEKEFNNYCAERLFNAHNASLTAHHPS